MAADRPEKVTTYRSTVQFGPSGTVVKRIAGEERLALLPTRHESFVNEMRIARLFATMPPPVRTPRLVAADETERTLEFETIVDAAPLGEKYPDHLSAKDLKLAMDAAARLSTFTVVRPWIYRPPLQEWIDYHHSHGLLTPATAALAARAAVDSGVGAFAHGDLSCRNILKRTDRSIVLIDWERAGLYPAEYDLAFLWYTTANLPGVRRRIEATVPPRARAGFWLSALLITLLHLDVPNAGHQAGARPAVDGIVDRLSAAVAGSNDA